MKRFPFKALSAVAALEFLKAPGFSKLEQGEREASDGGLTICKDGRIHPTLVAKKKPLGQTGRPVSRLKVADAD